MFCLSVAAASGSYFTTKTLNFRTYFVEYQFPVVAASRDQNEKNTTATETVRAVSKKVEKSGGTTSILDCNMSDYSITKCYQ